MKTVGIIAEYNPFHTGHEYQIDHAKKKLGADYVVIAMSGDFVQRGTPAVFSKYVRTKMALLGGADLVLELPVSVSTASAELFARGGVQLLSGLGVVDTLCFGSECGDTHALMDLAKVLAFEPETFQEKLRQNLKEGMTFPKARSQALCALFPDSESIRQILSSPNNILGIEYCKAILREKSSIVPSAIKREGNAYHETTLDQKNFPSASGIRRTLSEISAHPCQATLLSGSDLVPETSSENASLDDDLVFSLQELTDRFLPLSCRESFVQTVKESGFLEEKDLDLLYRYRLLQETEDSLCTYLDLSHSLARRILACRDQYETFSQFTDLLKTKEITRTRIQRALLHMLLHISDVPTKIPYARVLGFRKNSSALLGAIKKQGTIPLLTKLSDAPKLLDPDTDAMKLLNETTFASNLYESILAQKKNAACIHEYRQQIILL